jgi:hypothetical protein
LCRLSLPAKRTKRPGASCHLERSAVEPGVHSVRRHHDLRCGRGIERDELGADRRADGQNGTCVSNGAADHPSRIPSAERIRLRLMQMDEIVDRHHGRALREGGYVMRRVEDLRR